MTSLIQVSGALTGRGFEADRFDPLRTVRAAVDWPLPVEDSEETIRPDVTLALSRALAACGSVAFRTDRVLLGAELNFPPPPRSLANRVLDLAGLGGDAFGLAVAVEPELIATLFAYGGWSHALQLALVFDPVAEKAPILEALRGSLDWRDRSLPDGVQLLFGPGHDGDFAVVAARDAAGLDRFRSALS